MSAAAELILQGSAAQTALLARREELTALRRRLAAAEEELGDLRTRMKAFESLYIRQVGILYAELDALEARIVEREVDLYDSDAARARAEEARRRAQESHEAAFGAVAAPEEFDPPPDLKALFRDLAKRIHPDLARDAEEQTFLHALMARANYAYSRGDRELLQQMLDDQREVRAAAAGESAAAETERVVRQIGHARRDLAHLEAERHTLLTSEAAQLAEEVERAALGHRDLLAELATGVREQIAEAQSRFDRIDHQIRAHGR